MSDEISREVETVGPITQKLHETTKKNMEREQEGP